MTYIYICDIADNIFTAIEDTVLGMLMVFSVLAILWGAINLFRLLYTMAQKVKSSKAKKKGGKSESMTAPAVTAKEEKAFATEKGEPTNDAQIVAVISAALAEYLNVKESLPLARH